MPAPKSRLTPRVERRGQAARGRRETLLDLETRLQWAKTGYGAPPRRDRALVADAVRHFGSLAAALDAYRASLELVHGRKRVFADAALTRARLRSVHRLGLSLQPKVFGRADASLYLYARRHHGGSYAAALAASRLPVANILASEPKDLDAWLDAIRARAARGESLRRRDVAANDPALVRNVERHLRHAHGAVGEVGWDAGLRLSGFDPAEHNPNQRWSKTRVIPAIRARHAEGRSLRSKTVEREDPTLFHMAKHYYGGWPVAVEAAGFDPADERRRAREENRAVQEAAVLALVRSRAEAHLPVDVTSVDAADHRLVLAAKRIFRDRGGWDGVLVAAGLRPEEVHAAATARSADARRRWTDEALGSLLLDRLVGGLRLSPTALIQDGLSGALRRINERTGGLVGFCADLGIELEALGDAPRRKWAGDPDAVLRQIRAYADEGRELSASAIWQSDAGLHRAACVAFGSMARTPFGLYAGWDRALALAGVDPRTTRHDIDEDNGRGKRFDNLCQALFSVIRPEWQLKPTVWLRVGGRTRCLRPDALAASDNTWIDFKLRGRGASVVASVRKYGPHADQLMFVTLLGPSYPLAGATFVSVFDFEREASTAEVREIFRAMHLLASAANPAAERTLDKWAITWTKARVIAGIQALPATDLQSERARRFHSRLHWAAAQRFPGGWYAAVAAAGRDVSAVRKRPPSSTPEERAAFVVDRLERRLSLRCSEVCATADGRRVYKAACRYEVGGWAGLVERVGGVTREG